MENVILLSHAKKAIKLVNNWGEDCRSIPYTREVSMAAIGIATMLRLNRRKNISLKDFIAETNGTISMETNKNHFSTIDDNTKEKVWL